MLYIVFVVFFILFWVLLLVGFWIEVMSNLFLFKKVKEVL